MFLSSFFQGSNQESNEYIRLKKLEKKLKSAKILGEKHCVKCGFCCHKKPCVPTPDELKRIAKFLKLTAKELIEKCYVIDRQNLESNYYVKPAGLKTKDLVGKFLPADRSFNEGKCIFLDKNNLCKIYPVRPETARITKCWLNQKRDIDFLESWKGNQLLKQFGIDGIKEETK